MKLYNILEDIIFEDRKLLVENVSKSEIYDALDSHKRIKIYYQGERETRPEVRYIDVYAYGLSTGGNDVIRVYQAFGTTTSTIGWKLMRLDRVTRWEPTGFRFSPKSLDSDPSIPKRNPNGDNSMSTVYSVAKFNGEPNDNINKEKEYSNQVQQNNTPKVSNKPSVTQKITPRKTPSTYQD